MASTGWLAPTSTGSPNNDWAAFGDPTRAYVADDISVVANGTYQDYGTFGVTSFKSNTVIDGIQVRTRGAGSISPAPKCGIEISWNAGSNYTSTGKQTTHAGTDKGLPFYSTVGGTTDKWGRTWGISDFTTSNLRVRLENAVPNFAIDVVEIQIYYTEYPFIREAKGTLLFSDGATRVLYAKRSATGTLVFSGSALAIRRDDPSGLESKLYYYKVYDTDDEFVGVLDDVVDDLEFSRELNNAGSSTTLTLARNSDSRLVDVSPLLDESGNPILDENSLTILTTIESRNKIGVGSNIAHNYRIDAYVYYGEEGPILDEDGLPILDEEDEPITGLTGSPTGRRIFTGFVAEIEIRYGSTETSVVTLMSYGFDLDQYIVTDTGDTTVAFNSEDPSDIVKDGLDLFTAQSSPESYTTYTSATIETTGTVVSYTFRANTYLELLKKAIELAPSDWFFYVDLGSNLVYFKEKSATPQHYFYLGKHIETLNLRSYIGDVINDVLFTGGGDPALFKRYTETPVANTRRGLKRLSDSRVTLGASAEILSEGEIDGNKNIQYRSTVTILDNLYDIELIELGDVVTFRNFGNYVDTLEMQVVALQYKPESITLQLDTLPDSTNKRLEDLKRNLTVQENANVPDAPT